MLGGGLYVASRPLAPQRVSPRSGGSLVPSYSLFASTLQLGRWRKSDIHPSSIKTCSRNRMRVVNFALNTNASPSGRGEPDPVDNNSASFSLGSTRLGRLVSARRKELLQRWNTVRKNFPAKIFLLLFGFFFANALATILGQTGDWDVIAGGILVAIIEGIGHLMYNMPVFLGERGKVIVEFVNYWKIGFTFALFVDAFKVGS